MHCLLRVCEGEYKLITGSLRGEVVGGVMVVTVSCHDHGDPPLTTMTSINITIAAASTVSPPLFAQPVYNVTVTSHAPVFVIRVVAADAGGGDGVYYSFAESYPSFAIDRTTGVIRMLTTETGNDETNY